MHKMSSSVNIIRDSEATLQYFVTPNAEKTCQNLFENFENGNHAFNLIGSFGTGKSSFLWALQKSLVNNAEYFASKYNSQTKFIKIVGDYHSLSSALSDEFGVKNDLSSNQILFDAIYQEYQEIVSANGLLVIAIDEFGKFLEYASKNNPEAEIYFLQKLAEFVNKPDRNILLLTSVHQNLETYAVGLDKTSLLEWKKVKGRFTDLPFNEPIEQLLLLASKSINSPKDSAVREYATLIEHHNLFPFSKKYVEQIQNKVSPLSSISVYVLAKALQKYGQNERSLFTFLNSIFFTEFKELSKPFELPEVYDYLLEDFYNFIVSKGNPDYTNWSAIKVSLERIEVLDDINYKLAQDIIKSLGLLTIFSKSSSILNHVFFEKYFFYQYSVKEINSVLKALIKSKIIRFSSFDNSYKLFEGTDLDIELAISKAENRIEGIDILSKLNSHFEFPVIIAKSISYKTGTPRLFKFVLSNEPIEKEPIGEIDGFINLILSDSEIDHEQLKRGSINIPIIYGYFTNTIGIFETLLEIEKTQQVLKDMQGENDRVAIKELKSIIRSNEILLHHYVMNSLYTEKVNWFSRGNKVVFENKREFNIELSAICQEIYCETPIIQNELINRHKTSGTVSASRKTLWRQITSNSHLKALGHPENKWPVDKTIYYTLLERTGIHRYENSEFILGQPTQEDFNFLWQTSCNFLDEARTSRKSILLFHAALSRPPLKLKQGIIDFWVPLFLYLKRGDFALYNANGFVPYIDENVLYMLDRNTKEFEVKSFELNNLRLNLFNKYRDYLRQENKNSIDTESFIESIRPLLIFYRDLPEYAKETNSISPGSAKLREAISKAKDPERTFFEDFPDALGYSLNELASDKKVFEKYIIDFQNHIEEIKYSFDNLLNRFELFIQNELIGSKVEFKKYKSRLQDRFKNIKEHQALTRHKVFLTRINSNLDDRDSFLMSLGQALLAKQLNTIKDLDEAILFDKFKAIVAELDNLTELNKVKINADESLLKLQITSLDQGTIEKVVRLSAKDKNEVDSISKRLNKELSGSKSLKIPILLSLLNKELNEGNKA